eukprot:11314872-Prorocentrum_lima.AAC.1
MPSPYFWRLYTRSPSRLGHAMMQHVLDGSRTVVGFRRFSTSFSVASRTRACGTSLVQQSE